MFTHRTSLFSLATAALLIMLAGGVQANTLNVPSQYQTIQSAINAANTGDTILVGAGFYSESISWVDKDLSIIGASGSSHTVIAPPGGRCIYTHGLTSASRLQGIKLTNGSETFGGAIYNDLSSPCINSCVFDSDSAGSGGAIYGNSSSSTYTNCTFQFCSAWWSVGAFNATGGNPTLINCVFIQNWADGSVGALYSDTSVTLINCTFSQNYAGAYAGAIQAVGTVNLTNCILWDDTGAQGHNEVFLISPNPPYSTLNASHCDIEGYPATVDSQGNMGVDPQFVNADWLNLRLQSLSPCVDAGDNSGVPPGIVTDMQGNPRIVNTRVDIGAYEDQISGRPFASAGPDQHLAVPYDGTPTTNTAAVILDGSASFDPYGHAITYAWDDGQGHTATGVQPAFDLPAGSYTFTVTVTNDISLYRQDSVNIVIDPEPDAAPFASNTSISLNQDTSKSITLALIDPEGDYMVEYVSNPAHGTLSFGPGGTVVYTPSAGYVGSDSFNFLSFDAYGLQSNTATVGITVNHVNHSPVASGQSITTHNAAAITLKATDSDNDNLRYSVVSGPSHGTLSGVAPNLTYTPAANYSGADSFTFKANDGLVDSNVATVTISVTNLAPKAANDSATTTKATAVTINVLANDTDADGDPLTISSFTQPANGSVAKNGNNTLTFTPPKGFTGTTSFTYTIADGHGGSSSASVNVTVTK